VDILHIHPFWFWLKKYAADMRLSSYPYTHTHPHSRMHQFIMLLLFHPSSSLFSCPLAMTDGATFVLRHYISQNRDE